MSPANCPPPETLAAFAEGKLRGGERDEVVEHLAACDDCHTVVAETLHPLDELEGASGSRPRGLSHWKTILGLVLPTAAAAAFVALLVKPKTQPSPADVFPSTPVQTLAQAPPGPTAPSSSPPLAVPGSPPGAGATTDDPAAMLLRGRMLPGQAWTERPLAYGFAGTGGQRRRSFLLGVHVTDLALALGHEPPAEVARHVETLIAFAARAGFSEPVLSHYRALRDRSPGAEGSTLRPAAGYDRDAFETGQWVEAARRAALAHRADFLGHPRLREMLDRMDLISSTPAVRREVATLQRLLSRTPLTSTDLERLANGFAQAIRLM